MVPSPLRRPLHRLALCFYLRRRDKTRGGLFAYGGPWNRNHGYRRFLRILVGGIMR